MAKVEACIVSVSASNDGSVTIRFMASNKFGESDNEALHPLQCLIPGKHYTFEIDG